MADFHHSAFNIHIQVVDNDVLLKAALKTTDGQVNYDTIKLNEHIKNDHGKLVSVDLTDPTAKQMSLQALNALCPV